MAGRSLVISYVGDSSKVIAAQRQIDSGHTKMQGQVAKTSSAFKNTFGKIMPLAAAAAGFAIIKFASDSFKSLQRIETINAQTAAAIESTGGAANVTSEHVQAMAGEIENLTSVEAETVQEGANLLLTFTAIQNKVGEGNDIFDQATVAITDMSIALGQDMKSSAIQVGKALQDPILGMTALRRVGVAFTREQADMVRGWVEQGDILRAQKFILAELNKEFGGSAEALGATLQGRITIIGHKFGELGESLATVLLPAIETLIRVLGPVLEIAARNTNLVVAALAGFAAVRFVPPLLNTIAVGLVRLQVAAGASLTAQIALSSNLAAMGSAAGPLAAVTIGVVVLTDALQKFSIAADQEGAEAADTYTRAIEESGVVAVARGGHIAAMATQERGATNATLDFTTEVDRLTGASRSYTGTAEGAARATREAAQASREAEDATRDQRLAVLALSNSFLGILDSGSQVAEAQRELNRLERLGKTDTNAYEGAVLAAIEAQFGLEESILSYAGELIEAGEKQRDVERAVRDAAREYGIQGDAVRDLIGDIRDLIKLDGTNVTTTLTTRHVSVGGTTGGFFAQHGFHGEVTRPTMFIAGEAGAERVDITPRGQGGAGIVVNIGTLVAGDSQQAARTIRDELLKLKGSRSTLGLS